jgi:electron transport complex protein RnfG
MEIIKMSLFLFVVCAVAATALAFTDKVTKKRIAANKARVESEARDAVLGATKDKVASVLEHTVELGGETITVFEYKDEAKARLAFVLKGTGGGFGGDVDFVLGVDPAGKVLGVRVISHQETPGLGTKVTEVKAGKENKAWLSRLAGLTADEVALTKDDPKGKVDAITGVTISSRAMTEGVQGLLKQLMQKVEKDELGK